MKYLAALFSLLVLVTLPLVAQDLSLKHGDRDVTGDTIRIQGPVTTDYFEARVEVTNNREVEVNLKVRKTEIQSTENGENSFCWGECYTPWVTVSQQVIRIAAKATDRSSFIADYRPNGDAGTSIVRYTFFDTANDTIKSEVVILWEIGTSGLEEQKAGKQDIRIYPNPADQFMTLIIKNLGYGPFYAELINVQGRTIMQEMIPAGVNQVKWNTSAIQGGLYFLKAGNDQGMQSVTKVYINRLE